MHSAILVFLVFFIIWWRTVFTGRPAVSHIEWQNMALSLKGVTSSFQQKIDYFFGSLFLLLRVDRHEAADNYIESSTSTKNLPHSSMWHSSLQCMSWQKYKFEGMSINQSLFPKVVLKLALFQLELEYCWFVRTLFFGGYCLYVNNAVYSTVVRCVIW